MNPHELHHIKTYIVFGLVSVMSIGVLVYLYFPQKNSQNLTSSIIDNSIPITDVASETTWYTDELSKNMWDMTVSGRRMRLTQILIRAQKDLQTLEGQRKASSNWLDPVSEQKIIKLRQKIINLEKLIAEIK